VHATRRRLCAALVAIGCAVGVAACGDDEEPKTTSTAAEQPADDLQPIKDFLLAHTESLGAEATKLREGAEAYYALAEGTGFDYQALLDEHRDEVRAFVEQAQATFGRANPAYEEMEGVVAGVPSLADFDVIIDAGADKSDPENAVPFSLTTPGGKTYEQPGNFNYLIETSTYGTEPKFAAKGVEPDLDGDGEVSFGEALPDADFYVTAARDFEKTTKELDAAAREWTPTPQDAFTALVVMTPTMSEYFDAWKNSRFIAGDKAKEKAFVAASRLQDIADILGGLQTVYAGVEPRIAEVDEAQATQTGQDLEELTAFAERLRDEEAGGKKFIADAAETLGAEAQTRAEAIAGQVSQAAGQLDIPLET
jgi:ketosteroid isomerase-like protein